ncbi:hypothetical protein CO608_07945 [Lysobacteraceae bacterium NML08-0793]|nr:hypothetical protein CO608_07945 [Xanthomonadaceae bacterium NML08-0793]
MKKKSNKQRRAEISEKRRQRAQSWQAQLAEAHTQDARRQIAERAARQGEGVVMADTRLLAAHNNSYSLPDYYIDMPFRCDDCGAHEVWTAKQQKWWYEVALGNINSTARYCAECRRKRRAQRMQSKWNNPIEQQQAALHALAGQRPDAAAWEAIHQAIESKHWSTRVVAIQTVGQWWGHTHSPQTLAWLRRWLDEAPARIYADNWPAMAARAAGKAIASHIRGSDMPWVMQWLLEMDAQAVTPESWIWRLIDAMPDDVLLQALSSPRYHKALHDDAVLAPHLALMLVHCNENAPGNFAPWAKLAHHVLASPVLREDRQTWLQWLQWRLQRHSALHGDGQSAR